MSRELWVLALVVWVAMGTSLMWNVEPAALWLDRQLLRLRAWRMRRRYLPSHVIGSDRC